MITIARLLSSRAAICALACAVILAGAWLHGRSWERSRWTARMAASEAAYDRAAARAEGLAADLARADQERRALADQLDADAQADPQAGREALSRSAVRRLSVR